jgi:hypothetical protein
MRLADECRPLHGRPSLGLTVEQFLCPRRRLKDDDLVIGVDVSLSPLRELDLYLRAIIDGSIVWVADGADLSRHPGRVRAVPAAACGLWGPLKLERSRSQDKSARVARARSKIRDQRPLNAETRRINHARKQELADRKWRDHMRKMLVQFKGEEPSTSPWCRWVNDPLEPEELPPDWKPPPPPPHQLDDEPPF